MRDRLQKGDASKDVEAKRKELEAKRAASGPKGANQFYRVTVKVGTTARFGPIRARALHVSTAWSPPSRASPQQCSGWCTAPGHLESDCKRPCRAAVQDNGMGMQHKDIPNMLGRVLSGTKYGVKQTRGKFGLGAKMALIWSKMSTGLPVEVLSARRNQGFVSYYKLDINIHTCVRLGCRNWAPGRGRAARPLRERAVALIRIERTRALALSSFPHRPTALCSGQ
jgi:Histidine kinase-, DNA gyrase B-, and HSP90-like ATPase